MAESTCAVDGCGRGASVKSMCSKHAARMHRLGTTELPPRKPRNQPIKCSVNECERHAKTKGLCNLHASRMYRIGKTDLPQRSTETICVVDGCEKPIQYRDKGMCVMHYARNKRYGDPNFVHVREAEDLTGRRFGLLTVVERAPDVPYSWLCDCDCGGHTTALAANLKRGTVTRCGDGMHAWQDVASYASAHRRTISRRGPASAHLCIDCGEPANDWSYDYADPDELISVAHSSKGLPYSLNPAHYDPRCRPCHRVFDRTHREGLS